MERRHQRMVFIGIIAFFSTVLWTHLNFRCELWPLSSFGMYSQLSRDDYYIVELVDENGKDSMLELGSYRFFYNSYVMKILRKNRGKNKLEKGIISELMNFSTEVLASRLKSHHVNNIKVSYWNQFNYKKRNEPDYTIELRLNLKN